MTVSDTVVYVFEPDTVSDPFIRESENQYICLLKIYLYLHIFVYFHDFSFQMRDNSCLFMFIRDNIN